MNYKNLSSYLFKPCVFCAESQYQLKGNVIHQQRISTAAADVGKHYITHEITPRRLSAEECFLERMLFKKEAIWMLDNSKSNLILGALNQTLCSPHSLQFTHHVHTIS